MSLIDEVAADLHATAAALPVPPLRSAVADLHAALDRLTHAVVAGAALSAAEGVAARPALGRPGVARLAAAVGHAEAGIGLLHRAQDELCAYLAAVGRSDPPVRPEPTEPVPPARDGAPAGAEALDESWWKRRVDELYPEAARDASRAAPSAAGSADELVRRLAVATREDKLDELHPELRAVDAATGLALSGAAARHLPRLVAELVGRDPVPEDHPELVRRLDTRRLVPALAPHVPATVLARVCHLDPGPNEPAPDDQRREPLNPVDLAVAGGVLVALLLLALARDPKTLDEPASTQEAIP